MRRVPVLAGACAALALAALVAAEEGTAPAREDGWRTFTGTWSVSGRRQELDVAGGATAAIVQVAGPVILTEGAAGLARAFRAEAIGFSDGEGAAVGRCVWTDEHGDRLFSRLAGEPIATGRRIRGTFTGGTGCFEGWQGEYELTWQYVVADEDGRFQGRAVGLTGRVRRGEDR